MLLHFHNKSLAEWGAVCQDAREVSGLYFQHETVMLKTPDSQTFSGLAPTTTHYYYYFKQFIHRNKIQILTNIRTKNVYINIYIYITALGFTNSALWMTLLVLFIICYYFNPVSGEMHACIMRAAVYWRWYATSDIQMPQSNTKKAKTKPKDLHYLQKYWWLRWWETCTQRWQSRADHTVSRTALHLAQQFVYARDAAKQ